MIGKPITKTLNFMSKSKLMCEIYSHGVRGRTMSRIDLAADGKSAAPKMSSPSAATARLSLALLSCAAVVAAYYPTQRPTTAVSGSACRPPYGFRPQGCGVHETLNRVFDPACEYLRGPNVCLVTDTVRSNVVAYHYGRGCDWVYSHYYYQWIRQCNYVCQPSNECLQETQVFNRSYEICCEGFTARRRPASHYNPYSARAHYNYYAPLSNTPEGCPIAVGDSLLECLRIHGLTEFIAYIENSVYFDILNETTDSHITLFAPTNEALREAVDMFLIPLPTTTDFNISQMVGNHIVPGNVTMASLRQHGTKIYVNIEGKNLHRTSVTFHDSSYISRPENSYYNNIEPVVSSFQMIIPFISGARVVNEDSCNTINATLHIIDRVLRPTDSTIAEVLEGDPVRFSLFTAALDTVGILPFLNNPNVSRTVFAIENDVFGETFPTALMNCIGNYMRRPFNKILQFHVGQGAYYSSALALSDFFYTILDKFLRVKVDPETGDILLGPCESAIIDQDIVSASNGVVHVIERVLFPENFDFLMCSPLVPDPSPAECPPEPTLPSPSPTMEETLPSRSSFDAGIFPTPGSQFFFG